MDPFMLSALTYFALFLGFWSIITVIMLARILMKAKKERGVCRSDDKKMFAFTTILTIFAFIVVFVWPGLIYMIPSTVAFIELASIPLLGYVSEVAFKHWKRMKDTQSDEVDEHATI